MNLIDKAFGVHPQALSLLSQRSSVLASNIANGNTPNYLSRDMDFQSLLKAEQASHKVNLVSTSAGHLSGTNYSSSSELLYRVPTKGVVNGNTVEPEVEQAAFAENAVRYQTSLNFLSGTISGLKLAIKGQ